MHFFILICGEWGFILPSKCLMSVARFAYFCNFFSREAVTQHDMTRIVFSCW